MRACLCVGTRSSRRKRAPRSCAQQASRQWPSAIDQVVGILDEAAHDVALDRAVEVHGVPVPLILVVAGPDPGICRAQLQRPCRVALEVDGPGLLRERYQREHLAANLDHCDLLSEGVRLLGRRETEADRQDVIASHSPSVASHNDGRVTHKVLHSADL